MNNFKHYGTAILAIFWLLTSQSIHAQATDVDCDKCVDQTDIAQKAITSGKLANDAVTDSKLADKAVTTSKIKGSAVTQGKIRDAAVTTAKIRDGAVTPDKVSPELSNALGSYCLPGEAVVGHDIDGNLVCEAYVPALNCSDIEFDGLVWGVEVRGLDLRKYSGSTLHIIGVAAPAGELDSFYCEEDTDAGTLAFGTSANDTVLSTLIDPDNANRSKLDSAAWNACATELDPTGITDAPVKDGHVVALCNALGYAEGELIRSSQINSQCPEARAISRSSIDWSSNYQASNGGGQEYLCSN